MTYRWTLFALTIAFSLQISVLTPVAAKDSAAEIPIHKVALYSSGVGYFEHFGKVEGSAATELRFKTDQVNDILKSLVLEDLDGGKIGAAVYPSRDPVEKALRSFQVNLATDPDMTQLLQQLRGAKVKASVGAEAVEGTILGMEKRPKALSQQGVPSEVAVLNILSGATVRSLYLDELTSLNLEDPELQGELSKALETLAQSRDQDKKPITLQFNGQGERRVRLGYLVETPVWKTSYRLIMPDEGSSEAKIQGWAIVENQTDSDWNNVELSLVSGRPISFIQDLYQPLYVQRPVVQPEVFASLRPEKYAGAFGGGGFGGGIAGMRAGRAISRDRRQTDKGVRLGIGEMDNDSAPGEAVEQVIEGRPKVERFFNGAAAAAPIAAAPPPGSAEYYAFQAPMNPTASVASAAAAGELGELFQYTVGEVTLPRQRSAMIPIVTDPIAAKRLSIYNQVTLATHPLLGARLTNTTKKHLLQGPITVFEAGAYAGDSRIDNLPPDQNRLISYAIDLEVRANVTGAGIESRIVSGKIDRGVLALMKKRVTHTDYVLANEAGKEKTVLIEHPLKPGWNLTDTPKPVEKTDTAYRFEVALVPSSTSTLTVHEEVVDQESVALLPSELLSMEYYSKTGEISEKVRTAIAKAAGMKRDLETTQREIEQQKASIQEITSEQERIRANMNSVQSQQSQYYTRLLKKLDDQETSIEKMRVEILGLEEKQKQQQKALEDFLAGLSVG